MTAWSLTIARTRIGEALEMLSPLGIGESPNVIFRLTEKVHFLEEVLAPSCDSSRHCKAEADLGTTGGVMRSGLPFALQMAYCDL